MLNEQVLTVGDPAELIIPQEILKLIGVGAGDKIEIAVSDRKLIVRSLDEAEIEGKRTAISETNAAANVDEMMEAIMDRHDNLFRRLAEGPQ